MQNFINCPWCDSRNPNRAINCQKCGGPLPAEIGSDPGTPPPPAPRDLPKGYARRMTFKNSVPTLVGAIFLGVGLLIVFVFPVIGFFSGLILFIFIGCGLGGLFTALGGGLSWFGVQQGLAKIRPYQNGLATTGEVIEIFRDRSIQVNGRSPWAVIYTYAVNGTPYEGQVRSWKYATQQQAPGNRVHVLYMPDDPNKSVIYPPVS